MFSDELIDHNLKIFKEKEQVFDGDFSTPNESYFSDYKQFARFLEEEGLISIDKERCYPTNYLLEVIAKGGWIKYKAKLKEEENITIQKQLERENLELKNLQVNLDAHELNKKNSSWNKKQTIVNIALGIVNLFLIIYNIFGENLIKYFE